MNLLNTLLVYLTLLVSSSVQQAPALTPPPLDFVTPAPAATSTPYIPPTAVPTAMVVPPPSASPAPIDPSLTTVRSGDRGENVRTLQRRLIELGYLQDAADGIFGRNTKRAVERFQNYNNLTVDGVAGRNTLNKLYNDPNVVIAPVDIPATATPRPATPRPIATAMVPVTYVDENSKVLFQETLMFQEGITTVKAVDSHVPAGYTLTSAREAKVTVDQQGRAAPASISFIYQSPPVVTATPAATATATAKPTATAVPKPTETPVPTATNEPDPTETPVPTETTAPDPTETPVPTETTAPEPTETPVPTETTAPEPTQTAAPTNTPAPYQLPAPMEGAAVGAQAVYTGPGDTTYAVPNNPGVADGQVISFYGKTGDWAMIGFDNAGHTSVGYIPAAAAPEGMTLTELQFTSRQVVLAAAASLTDTPKDGASVLASLPEGATVTLLGAMNDLAYIETTVGTQTARGFIPMSALGQ